MSIGSIGGPGSAYHAHSHRLTFDEADTDGSGDISLEEFSAIGQNVQGGKSGLDSDALKSLFSAIDTDGNGAVSRTEAKTAYDKLSQAMQTQLLGAQEQYGGAAAAAAAGAASFAPPSLDSVFQAADTDSSGGLSFDEFKAGVAANAPSGAPAPSNDALQKMFDAMDADGDGSVSAAEMKAAAQHAHHHHRHPLPQQADPSASAALIAQASGTYGTQASATDILNQLTTILTSA